MSDKEKPWEELLASSKTSREEAIKAVTSALALLHALNKGAPPPPAQPIVSDLLFDLASLQTETIKKLAEISARQTGAVVDALKNRRAQARPAGGPPVRVLVSKEIPPGKPMLGTFTIRNDATHARGYPLPGVVCLDRLGTEDKGPSDRVYVDAQFKHDHKLLEAPKDCAQPFYVQVPARSHLSVTLVIPWDDRLKPGRYRAVVALEADDAPSAELIVELWVKGQGT
jgi:hypothetical protein